jgi:hypothetical protein
MALRERQQPGGNGRRRIEGSLDTEGHRVIVVGTARTVTFEGAPALGCTTVAVDETSRR